MYQSRICCSVPCLGSDNNEQFIYLLRLHSNFHVGQESGNARQNVDQWYIQFFLNLFNFFNTHDAINNQPTATCYYIS